MADDKKIPHPPTMRRLLEVIKEIGEHPDWKKYDRELVHMAWLIASHVQLMGTVKNFKEASKVQNAGSVAFPSLTEVLKGTPEQER